MLNRWENHRLEFKVRSALVYKLFFFQFVNCYFLLFYIGFAKPLSGHLFGLQDT